MCGTKEDAKTKLDKFTASMDRLSAAIERLLGKGLPSNQKDEKSVPAS